MNNKLILFLVLIFFATVSLGQSKDGGHDTYQLAGGLRLGSTPGFTFKGFVSGSNAVELIVHTRHKGFLATGLYEIHKQAFDEPRLHWFYGAGGHAGYYSGRYFFEGPYKYSTDPEFNLGVDGVLGIEYHIQEIPFTVGLDIKPYIDVLSRFWPYMDGALTVRYVIK